MTPVTSTCCETAKRQKMPEFALIACGFGPEWGQQCPVCRNILKK
jgi:hypothetical protein